MLSWNAISHGTIANRDLPTPDFCQLQLYTTLTELAAFKSEIAAADAVIIGSYVHQGPEVIDWVAACRRRGALCFYDIDTPVTLRQLATGGAEYLLPRCVPMFDIYFSLLAARRCVCWKRLWCSSSGSAVLRGGCSTVSSDSRDATLGLGLPRHL